MSETRITVILPAFNAGETIARAISSVRGQTLQDWNLLVIDDGSTDDTVPRVLRAGEADERVRLIQQPHAGIVSALNRGVEEARSPFIARMDADDESHPERLAEQVALLEASPTIGLAGCLVAFGGDRLASAGYALHVDWINSLVTPEEIALRRFVESPFAHPSVVFRREVAQCHGPYREGAFPEDYELWLRWMEAGVSMAKVPRVLLTWHDSPGRLSRHDPRYESEAFYRCKAVFLASWLRREVIPSRPILVWGAGRLTRRRVEFLIAEGITVTGFIDVDPNKTGRSLFGRPVLDPSSIPPVDRCFVLTYVAKRGAREFARSTLTARGFVEGKDFLAVA